MINYRGLNIPFVSFGNVTSDDLFCDKEQVLFDFYAANAKRYRKALDIGANIGVHTMLMQRQGWWVHSYEPDPDHYIVLVDNVARNPLPYFGQCGHHEYHQRAVSDHDGTATFVRVKGNTTGSHLKGDKQPYGDLEEFEVPVVDCRPLFAWADFAKIDCEGHEARLLLTVRPENRCEFMVEVGNRANAEAIYEHFMRMDVPMWTQKTAWHDVRTIHDMPQHHSEGALFIGRERPFP